MTKVLLKGNVKSTCAALLLLGFTTNADVWASALPTETNAINVTQQTKMVTGTVVDEYGQPLIGASVLVKGTSTGQITDLDGHFTVQTQSQTVTLLVSYIGYTKQEVTATAGKSLKISMIPDSNVTEEVVVTGYGTFKKSAFAGSASSVKADKLADIPVVSFQDMLQGNAPGVQFQQQSGQPGSSVAITIRGMGSINASTTPLYVVDGVAVTSGNISSLGSDNGLDIMSTLNTSDIENITIIKDAAAASLYGSRAANGVVLITTKKGKEGKAVVNLKADWGISDFAMDYRPTLSGEERRDYIYNGMYLGQIKKGKSEADAKTYADGKIDKYAPNPWCGYTDWNDVMFRKGSHSNYEASITGGSDRFKYYSSLAYMKQEGITKTSALERITGRLNVDFQATKKLKLGANIMFASLNQNVYGEGTGYTTPFYSTVSKLTPSDYVYNEDGTFNRNFISLGDRNPALAAKYNYKREYVTRTFNTLNAEYEFIKDLKLKTTLSYDYNINKGKEWYDSRTSDGEDESGIMVKAYSEYNKLNWNSQLSYQITLKQNHHLDALVGYEIESKYNDDLWGQVENFQTPDKNEVDLGAVIDGVGGSSSDNRLVSYLSRVNYDYKHKYYLGGSYRTDGSSRLHRDSRWGNFWSVSGAWRVIEEGFMKPVSSWLTDLRLRASYGVNGTLPSDLYGYMGLSSLSGSYMGVPGFVQSKIENRDLKWETNYNLNLGLDFGLFNRVNVTFEYYIRNTKDLLFDCPISLTTGFSTYLMNMGELKNKGFELDINSTNITTKDFTWTTNFNLSHNSNEVVKLDGQMTEQAAGVFIHKIGESYRTFNMIQFAGINPENGAPQFYTNTKDENGNYVKDITEDAGKANAIPLDKRAEPSIIGGLTNSLRYKWFDLSFMFSYQFGAWGYDNWAQKTEHGGSDFTLNIPAYYRNNWKKEGDHSTYEVFMEGQTTKMNKVTSDRRLHKTDFIRLKTLNFGVTMPKNWTSKLGINSMRLYASANNLWTWASWDFYDPESVINGVASWGTPPLKSVTFGLNLKF